MRRIQYLYASTVGKKVIVAVTGLVMVGFLVGHVTGNLKVFLPDPEPGVADIDVYAEFLRTVGEPLVPANGVLWLVRLVLLAAVVLHIVCVAQLVNLSRKARPTGYRGRRYLRATLAARLMLVSGLALFAFVVFHILHFTTGTVDPGNFDHGEVYANLYRAFVRWPFVALYVVAMAAVSAHVYHGAWSLFQSLGLDAPSRNRLLRTVATLLAILLFVGFVSVPLSFVGGVLGPPEEGEAAVLEPSSEVLP